MWKTIFWVLLVVVILNALKNKVKNAMDIKQLLLDAGFPAETINLFMAQFAFESGGFNLDTNKGKIDIVDNNLTGINFINKPYQHATKGTAKPKSEWADKNKPEYYARFTSLKDWAKDYKRILSFGAKPIEATNVIDLVDRLKANRYFQSDKKSYANGVSKYFSQIS